MTILPLIGIAFHAADAQEPAARHVYIGTGAAEPDQGIYLFAFDPETGALEARGRVADTPNASFLAVHPGKPVLYAVSEVSDGVVDAFGIDPETGALEFLNRQPSGGAIPCHVAVAPSGRFAAVANYVGGTVALYPVLDDGRLGPIAGLARHEGSSVNQDRQDAPHPHSVNFDPAGRVLLAADLGVDKVYAYRFADDGLTPNDPPYAPLAPGAGPRHLTFADAGRFVYVVNELDSTVTAFTYDVETGRMDAFQTATTLPEGFDGESTTAEIRVHPSGRFLYASNRGHDSIAGYRIDAESGRLASLGQTPTGGRTPRNFNIDPSGRFLLAANQDSGTVVVFRIDPDRGTLEPTGASVDAPKPMCVTFSGRR